MKPRKLIAAWLPITWLATASLFLGQQADTPDVGARATTLIAKHCLSCHGTQATSGLNLTTREDALRGGQHGPALVPGDPEASLLWNRVSAGEMPLGNPLPPRDRRVFHEWIAAGAPWSELIEPGPSPDRADSTWWAFKPIQEPQPPSPDGLPDHWEPSPFDRFVYARMMQNDVGPSPPADRRTLVRRASFDLIGLPATPEETETFIKDPSPDAYEKLIDRLLASPRYGERWGRHWLDVARFAESEGFERDWLRENAWPYRDYVIRSFNDDKPYLRFAQEQIAGDVLEPVTRDGIAATAFLITGPTDVTGLWSAVAAQREAVRHDQLEEMIGTVSQTFLGLTVNCARCHDHKYDPISQRDYYRMKAALESVWPCRLESSGSGSSGIPPCGGARDWLIPDEQRAYLDRMEPLEKRIAEVGDQLAALEVLARQRIIDGRNRPGTRSFKATETPSPFAQWTFDLNSRDWAGSLHARHPEMAELMEGRLRPAGDEESVTVETVELPQNIREKTLECWVLVRKLPEKPITVITIRDTQGFLGAASDGIQYAAEDDKQWTNVSGGRFRDPDVAGPPEEAEEGQLVHIAIAFAADHSIRLYRNGKPYGEAYTPDLTIEATHLQTYRAGETVVSLTASKDFEFEEARLYNVALTEEQVEASYRAGVTNFTPEELLEVMAPDEKSRAVDLRAKLLMLKEQLEAIPKPDMIFAAETSPPGPTYLLKRGDISQKGERVAAGALSCISSLSPDFGLEADAPEADRRLMLARWLANPENPLFARTMVNRVWHYHFGKGFVANPNDLGFNGGEPTHPELLDWLATKFISSGWSVKKLHRLIMMSETYRQASDWREDAATKDAGNRFLWRYLPRRLEGEAVRDAMLSASGLLNEEMGGPSFRPFTMERTGTLEHYTMIDSDDPAFNRRTVYRMNVSSASSPLLDSLDCPNPSLKAPDRGVTTTALQALSLMNNAFVVRQANAFADRVEGEAGGDLGGCIRRAFALALGRAPRPDELAWSEDLVEKQGLTGLCWGLFNTSEFLYLN